MKMVSTSTKDALIAIGLATTLYGGFQAVRHRTELPYMPERISHSIESSLQRTLGPACESIDSFLQESARSSERAQIEAEAKAYEAERRRITGHYDTKIALLKDLGAHNLAMVAEKDRDMDLHDLQRQYGREPLKSSPETDKFFDNLDLPS